MSPRVNHRTIVIGAGITGLTAAYQLLRNGYDGEVYICDSNNQASGRLQSVPIPDSEDVIELGAGRFHIRHHAAFNRLRLELGLEVQPFNFPASYGGMAIGNSSEDGSQEFCRLLSLLEANLAGTREARFTDFAVSVIGTQGLRRLVAITGYDTLSNPSLPVAGGMSILRDHPEGQSYVSRQTDEWFSIKGGFQSLLTELEQRLANRVQLHYKTTVEAITALPEPECGYQLRVRSKGMESTICCDAIILATTLHGIHRMGGLDCFSGLDGLDNLESVPLLKGFCRFSNPWWRTNTASGRCVINSTPLRKVYLSERGNLIWFYCDGESALRTSRILDFNEAAILELLEDHLGCRVPTDAVLEDFTWKFWHQGISFLRSEKTGTDKFREVANKVVVCSDIYTEHVGWLEGGLLSAQAGTQYLAHRM